MSAAVPVGVIHGRFQIFHNDHLRYLLAGKERCRHMVVGITNPDPLLTRPETADPERSLAASNPLTYYERYQLVRVALGAEGLDPRTFSIVPFPINLPDLYRYYVPLDAVFFVTIYDQWGRDKLARFRSLGLHAEVLWERTLEEKGVTGTAVRALMAAGEPWEHLVPASVVPLLLEWHVPERVACPASGGA